MVRLVELRPWVRIRTESGAPPWTRRQQVYLVRFDVQRRGLPILPDAQTREVKIFGDRPRRKPALQGVYASGSCRSLLCEPLFAASHLPRSDFMSPINPVLATPHIAITVESNGASRIIHFVYCRAFCGLIYTSEIVKTFNHKMWYNYLGCVKG